MTQPRMSDQRLRTIRLIIEYNGTHYQGWQVQPKGSTVQGVIEQRLRILTREPIQLIGSGRTDAGAHALAQVAHFKTRSSMGVRSIQRALNALLPPDIAIRKVEEVGEDFHARKHARAKVYEYRILNRETRSVFDRDYAWHLPQRLDLGTMRRATAKLIGEHDFSCFCSSGSSARTAVREVMRAEWKKGKGGILRFEIEATGFLKQMVRAMVGTLVEVGKGKITPEQFQRILESKDRTQAGPTAPAYGLYLKQVKYEETGALRSVATSEMKRLD